MITLILITSALPVKSDAFAISNSSKLIQNRGTVFVPGRTKNIEFAKLYALEGSNVNTFTTDDVPNLRGGGDTNSLSLVNKISAYMSKNFFLLGMVVAVSFAKLFPELGKNGSLLRPELFIGNYGVTTIFLLSGISLKLKELTNAAANMKLNGLIQMVTFGAWPFLVGLPMTKGIEYFFPGLLPTPLLEGLMILCCLPTTINMCIILTSAADGNGKKAYL